MKNRPSLVNIAGAIAKTHDMDIAGLWCRGRRNQSSMARSTFCHEARKVYGYTLYEVAAFLGITATAVAGAAARYVKNECS